MKFARQAAMHLCHKYSGSKLREIGRLFDVRESAITEGTGITGSVFNQNEKLAAKVAIHLCHRYSGAKLKEIGERFGVKESAVSQSSRRFTAEQRKDKKLQDIMTGLVKRLNLCNV